MNAKAQDSRTRPRRQRRGPAHHVEPSRRSSLLLRPWTWVALVALVLIVGGVLGLAAQSWDQPGGTLAADNQFHDFGQVRISDGIVLAKFPLAVHGATLVTEIATS